MTDSQFQGMKDDIMYHAIKAQKFAEELDLQNLESRRSWYALADRLFEALDQAENMGKVVKPSKA